ncbi:hypothetical protein D5269_06270 [Anaerotruncus sp. 1XD42-93]|nr:hypothetical protein [Anaerotruncus sp. 1XD42-93]
MPENLFYAPKGRLCQDFLRRTTPAGCRTPLMAFREKRKRKAKKTFLGPVIRGCETGFQENRPSLVGQAEGGIL